MALPGGYGSAFGLKKETTFGTAVVVNRFHLIDANESLQATAQRIDYRGVGGGSGLLQRADMDTQVIRGAGGDVTLPVTIKSMGVLLQQIFGTSTSTQVSSTAEYTQAHTPDTTAGRIGVSATLQKQVAQRNGTVVPFTYPGAKVQKASFSCSQDGYLMLTVTWLASTESQSSGGAYSAASVTFATANPPFNWTQGVISLNSVTTRRFRTWTLDLDWGLETDEFGLGNVLRAEPTPNGEFAVSGTLDASFENTTDYAAFIAGTDYPLTVTFTGATIPTAANPFKIVFTMPDIRLIGETPKINAEGATRVALAYKAMYDGTNPIVSVTQSTNDTAL